MKESRRRKNRHKNLQRVCVSTFYIDFWPLCFSGFYFEGFHSLILVFFFTPEIDDIFSVSKIDVDMNTVIISYTWHFDVSRAIIIIIIVHINPVRVYVQYSTVARRIGSVTSWRSSIWYQNMWSLYAYGIWYFNAMSIRSLTNFKHC